MIAIILACRHRRTITSYWGVEPGSEASAIRTAYRNLMRRHHSDLDPEGASKARLLNVAYDVLGKPEKRHAYDLERKMTRGSGNKSGEAGRREKVSIEPRYLKALYMLLAPMIGDELRTLEAMSRMKHASAPRGVEELKAQAIERIVDKLERFGENDEDGISTIREVAKEIADELFRPQPRT